MRQQYSASGAPRRRQVSRIRAAAAEWRQHGAEAVAAEGGSTRDKESGGVVGGKLDAISM